MVMNAKQQCPACNGRRLVNDTAGRKQVCPLCEGSGSVTPQPIRVPFDYVIDEVLLASASRTASLNFSKDAPFEWIWLVATKDGSFTSEFKDVATGRDFQNLPVNDANRFGTAQLPFPLVEPYIFAPGTALGYTLVDTSVAENTIQIVLKGYKLFPAAAA